MPTCIIFSSVLQWWHQSRSHLVLFVC